MHTQSMFVVKIGEIMYTPANPTFHYTKWDSRGWRRDEGAQCMDLLTYCFKLFSAIDSFRKIF